MLFTNITKKILDNSLTVLVKENHSAAVAAIFTYVKAGYFNEPDRLVGISHLIEHMFFKGTQKRGNGQIAMETKALGGYLNASTIYDHTLYYTVVPSKNLSQGLDIQSDALINSNFDSEELKKETEVVIQEAKRKLDIPAAVAREKLFGLAFEKHRIKRWRIGTETGLRSLTRDDILTFYKNVYRPENIIVVVVGDVETKYVLQEIEKYYNEFEDGVIVKEESPAEPSQAKFKYKYLSGDIQQCYLTIGFHAPPIRHPDTFALEILGFILGRGRSSRFYQSVKEKNNLVHSIAAANFSLKDVGVFFVEANVQPEKLREAEEAIFDEIEKMRKKLVTKAELIKARNVIGSLLIFNMESVSGQAHMLAEYEALGDYNLAEEYFENLINVTEEDIFRVANKYLTLSNCSLLEYVPENSNLEQTNANRMASVLEQNIHSGSYTPKRRIKKREDSKFKFPYVSGSRTNKPIMRHVLTTGTTLLLKENHQLPLVSVGIFAKGGRNRERPENAGISALSVRTAMKGTQKRSARQIAFEIENLGAGIQYSNNPDFMGFTLNILSKNFKKGCDVIADILTEPTFPDKELNKEKENIMACLLRERDDMFHRPLKIFYANLFKDHAYGLSPHGTPDSVKSISRDDLKIWHFHHFKPDNLVVSLVGDFLSQNMINYIENRLIPIRSIDESFTTDSKIIKPKKIEEGIEKSNKNQTAIVLGFQGPGYAEDDYYVLTVLQNVISGLGGRFFEELRGRRSLAYTVSAFVVARLFSGAFVSYIATSPEKERDAKDGLLREFEKLTRDGITQKELEQAIQYTIGTHQIGLETSRAQMVHYAINEILGRKINDVAKFPEMITKITTDRVLEAARKYFNLKQYAVGMVRGNAGKL